MNAIEIADELKNSITNDCLNSKEEEWYSEIEAMLRQQAKEIEELKLRELSDEEIRDCCKRAGVIIHVEYMPSWIKDLVNEIIKASRGEK